MPENEIKITPFVGCTYLYQAVLKLVEEAGEVAQVFYRVDTKEGGEVNQNDVDWLVEECGDVIQAAVNIIVRCGYDPQDVMDTVTQKNVDKGYYNAE